MINILYLTNHLNIGGITSYVLTLASGLKKRGHNVYVASYGGQLLSRFTEAGAVYIPIPIKTKKEISPKILVSILKLSSKVKLYNIDILHSHSRTTQVLGSLLGRARDIPHILTCHGFFKPRFLRKVFPCWADKTIAISEPVREHLIKDFGVKEQDIRVIHNGVDVDRFRNQSPPKGGMPPKAAKPETRNQKKKELGLREGPVVGIIARLSEEKGHIYLIEAMKSVLEKIPDTQLLIVGEGRMKEKLVRQVLDLKLQKNVLILPSVVDTGEVLSVMDLFVMPSLKEGLGLSLMEAMASGLSVIGTDVGGIKSLIQDGENGLLVKPANSIGLAQAILELLGDTAKSKVLGKNAQDFIGKNFSQEKMILETERVYLECLNLRS